MSGDKSNILPEYVYKYMSFDVAKIVLREGTLGFSKSQDFGRGLGILSDENEIEFKLQNIAKSSKTSPISFHCSSDELECFKMLSSVKLKHNPNGGFLTSNPQMIEVAEGMFSAAEQIIVRTHELLRILDIDDINNISAQEFKGRLDNYCRVCCLSDRNNNNYLWRHIADNEKVVCLQLDTRKLMKNYDINYFDFVTYEENVSEDGTPANIIAFDTGLKEIIFTKSKKYSEEKEVRLAIILKNIEGDENFSEKRIDENRIVLNDKRLKEYLVDVCVKGLPLELKEELDEIIAGEDYDVKKSRFITNS